MQQYPLNVTGQVGRSAQRTDGFTLLELLTVIVCVGILAGLIIILRH